MPRRTLKWVGFVLLDFAAAFLILVVYFDNFPRLLTVRNGTDRPVWLNVTPGCRDTIPTFFLMRRSPWPLPRDQDVAAVTFVSVQPGGPVVVRGRPNPCRYWGFVFYPSQGDTPEADLPVVDSSRVALEPDGSYVITFSQERAEGNWVDVGSATGGLLFMRNYVPARGARIAFPDVYWGDRLMTAGREVGGDG
jgi:hypothetical protein